MTAPATANRVWAEAFAAELVAAGVRHVALSPGNRSAPLALAMHAQPGLELSVHVDERVGAYFALGRARATGGPVATLTTSGTAVANQLPAVVEAHHSCLPLIVLSADRPPRLRGMGANQTIDQARLLATHTNWSFELAAPDTRGDALDALRATVGRAVARALGPPAGPVHLNVPFDEPLAPAPEAALQPVRAATGTAWLAGSPAARWLDDGDVRSVAKRIARGRGLIVVGPRYQGDAFAPALSRLAARLACPVLADPLSGVRYAPQGDALILGSQDAFLSVAACAEALRPDWVLQFGASPTSKQIIAFLAANRGTARILIDETGRHPDAAGGSCMSLVADAPRAVLQLERALARETPQRDAAWRARFSAADAAVQACLKATGDWEATVPRRALAALGDGDRLFVGSSLPVRDLDRFAPHGPDGVRVHANRGASGIDGSVSSAAGVASAHRGRTIAVVGDLALQHDLGGLAALRRAAPGLAVVVLNNGGGAIFQGLPVAQHDPPFTELFLTPHELDIEAAARTHRLAHHLVEEEDDDLTRLLQDGASGVVEVKVDREGSWRRRAGFAADLARRLEAAGGTASGEEHRD